MSTVADPKLLTGLPPDNDPFNYGFRNEQVLQSDGTFRFRPIALTLEDHLHPHEGDHFADGTDHDILRSYLRDHFRLRLKSIPTALVLSRQGVYWDDPDLGHHCPDIAVIFAVVQQRRKWTTFYVAEHRTRPHLIIELVTPRYRKNDVEEKFSAYHRARVPNYVILDREFDDDPWSIKAYQFTPKRYVLQPLEKGNRLWLPDLNLWLAEDGFKVNCIVGKTGEVLGDIDALSDQNQQIKELAETQTARAEAAEAKNRKLEAELARLKGQHPPS